ncbi:hypothetical protein [Methylogaea oryzae]|uniref:Uncharacterized protein n=1 Tax=Methylogaea oryzae TaxID=1295382 RepID=A0A8D5AH86_9GAMM|nr:hypothetical protein [Methylogaea oryzae]BBL70016.1 hypothetical protein MoryE10_06220 [Methylogaea oryzae]
MPQRSIPLLFTAIALLAGAAMPALAGEDNDHAVYKELLESSLKDKRGLKFFINGNTVGGAVTRLIGDEAVEVRNQEFGRIVIRLDRVDAIAGQ